MKIAILVEGETELGFKVALRKFLEQRLSGKMPNLDFDPCRGRIPKAEKLRRVVEDHLRGCKPADAVIALTDVYTGTDDFADAADAKAKMRAWVGPNAKFSSSKFDKIRSINARLSLRMVCVNANQPQGGGPCVQGRLSDCPVTRYKRGC